MSRSRPPKCPLGRGCGVCRFNPEQPKRRLATVLTRTEALEVDHDISQWSYDRWQRFDVEAGRWRWAEVDFS